MKIVQVVQEFSLKGGVECVSFELQRAWNELGVQSEVVAGTAPGYEYRTDVTLLKAPFRDIATRGSKFSKYVGRMTVVPAFTISVTRYLRKHRKSDLILSHGDSLYGDALVIHAVNKASLKAKRDIGNYGWILNPMHWWVGTRDRWMIGGLRYKRYIAISKRVAHEIQTLYGVPEDRITIIPNGVNVDRFTPNGPGRAQIRVEFGIPRRAPVLLFIGHEFDRKGLVFAIRALGLLPNSYYLMVVGNDNPEPYRTEIESIGASNRVLFTGARQDIPAICRAADAFVFPTNYEAFGLVTMEALASGLPIIATSVGGIEDYLKDGENGYFITRDPVQIAEAIQRTFQSPEHRTMLAVNARKTAMHYTWHEIAKQYYHLLTSLKE